MALIWLLTVITFLSQRSSTDYVKTNRSGTWADMRNECTLATPTITYSAKEISIEIDQHVELAESEKLWVGYTEDIEVFQFYGCIQRHKVKIESSRDIQATFGLCYSACSTVNFFGVMVNGMNKIRCHCIEEFQKTDLISCGSSDDSGFALGVRESLALYERVSFDLSNVLKGLDTWKNISNSCLNFYNPSLSQLQWLPCETFYAILCEDLEGRYFPHAIYGSWKKAVDECFDKQLYPVRYRSNMGLNSTIQYWLANIRSLTISKYEEGLTSPYTKYGYITTENSKLILGFTAQGGNFKGLCVENKAGVDRTSEDTAGKSKLIGVYVAVPIVILLAAIVVGTVVLVKRRRRSSPEQVDNTKRNLTYEPDMQPNQNTHRPDSAEVYHEIQDVTESTNEGYDTIPDGYLHKSTQNNTTEVDYFVLEKHDNAHHEFAREVTGETEHEYGGQPFKITTAVTDDYDHIGEGNTAQKQSLGDQPYDKTSNVVKEKDWDPTYDHSGDHTTYDHTGDNSTFDRTADRTTYDHTGRHTTYDHTGDHTTYDHTGNYAINEGAVNSANTDHIEDNADYDHIADHSS